MRRPLAVFSLTFLLLALAACVRAPGPDQERVATVVTEDLAPVHSLVVLPVRIRPDGPDVDQQQLAEGATVLRDLLFQYFEDQPSVSLISEEREEALSAAFTGSRGESARLIGERLGSDAVLLAEIVRFLEREGTTYASDRPASVAFQFRLIRVASGRTVCIGQFDETQQALSENLFAFSKAKRRGLKWLTAEQLAREGLRRELEECEPLASLRQNTP